VFTTAHDALFTQCGVAMGDRVCVHGAAGGVGLAGVQLARAAGASVVATVRNDALREGVASFGADVVAPDAFVERGPFDVILELIGAPNMAANFDALAMQGRIVVIGVGGGADAAINLLAVMQRRAVLRGSTLRTRSLEDKAAAARAVEHHVLPLLTENVVRVPIEECFPMANAQAAYDRFAAGGKLGKIVLTAAS
jgi:NADPH:quinone reductase-like Zn-dependent oxidoreductase